MKNLSNLPSGAAGISIHTDIISFGTLLLPPLVDQRWDETVPFHLCERNTDGEAEYQNKIPALKRKCEQPKSVVVLYSDFNLNNIFKIFFDNNSGLQSKVSPGRTPHFHSRPHHT